MDRVVVLDGVLEQYEDGYRLCYVLGPEGIIVALAEKRERFTGRRCESRVSIVGSRSAS